MPSSTRTSTTVLTGPGVAATNVVIASVAGAIGVAGVCVAADYIAAGIISKIGGGVAAVALPSAVDMTSKVRAAVAFAAATTAGVAAPYVATAGMATVGFTNAGVAAGSVAAGIQSGIGNVAAGSLFSACQSLGATGGFALLGPVGLGAAVVTGAVAYYL